MLTMPPQKTCASLHKDLQHRTPRHFTTLFPLYLRSLPWSRLPTLLHLARTSVDSKKHYEQSLRFLICCFQPPSQPSLWWEAKRRPLPSAHRRPKGIANSSRFWRNLKFHHNSSTLSALHVFLCLFHLFSGNLTQEGHKKSACLSQVNWLHLLLHHVPLNALTQVPAC